MGERAITGDVQTVIAGRVVTPVFFIEFEFLSDTLRIWTGFGSKDWDGKTWTGTGNLLGISGIQEGVALRANAVAFQLTGMPTSLISIALNETYQGRSAKMWLGFLDSSDAVIADPVQVFGGKMDVMAINDEGETATIQLSVESELADLERPRVRRYTDEDQHIDYPDDQGFKFVAGLQDKKINWGRADASGG